MVLSVIIAIAVGLLRRWRWAHSATIALLVVIFVSHGWKLVQGPRPTTTTTASGVVTTTIGSDPNVTSLPIMLVCIGLMLKLVSPGTREEFQSPSIPQQPSPPMSTPEPAPTTPDHDPRGWRVGHRGRDMMYYEEKIAGAWHRIDLDGEMLMGRAHHVIYFATPERWQAYPEWARHRRSEIILRIKSEFREPDYEYA